ncbi:hypothetical protein Barb6_03480 [Bacteroidales bacterium Barb6]|nr:hypothetical protein Barb6_03480 [Bacteroidales bacterium Barb6]
MQTAGNEHDQIVKAELATSETLFDNTTFFDSANGMLNKNAKTGYFFIFFFLSLRELFAFGLLGWHFYGCIPRLMPQEDCVLP